jgi:RHS repeat-associated protein
MYDDRWRILTTFRDQDASPKESFVYHAAGMSGEGDASYIDSVVLRDRDAMTGTNPNPWTSASDGVLDKRIFYCQNWRADIVALTQHDGTPIEFVRYSAYGEATVHPVADFNMDGVANASDSADYFDLAGGGAGGKAAYETTDLNFDGVAPDTADDDVFMESYNTNHGQSGAGRVSSAAVANRKGYAGYEHDRAINAYHVRHRVYMPEIGRWSRRDPLGYVDGMGLYEYVKSQSIQFVDPFGQQTVAPSIESVTPGIIEGIRQGIFGVADLVAMGFTRAAAIALIAAVLNSSREAIKEAIKKIVEKIIKSKNCKSADRLYAAFCKGNNAPKNCDKMESKNCNRFKQEAGKHSLCAAAREAIRTLRCNSHRHRIDSPGWQENIDSHVNGAAKCLAKYAECLQKQQDEIIRKNNCNFGGNK